MNELKQDMRDLQEHNQNLFEELAKYKDKKNQLIKDGYGIYHAFKEDHIDQALGEFLNQYPEQSHLKIMFLRESEGVYFFGSKRVYIKIGK